LHNLERACNIQIAAQSAGNAELLFPPAEVVAKVEKQASAHARGDGPKVALHWDALVRQLERHDLDYRL
jgi:hypothetical protein